jgi:hypothetical protein
MLEEADGVFAYTPDSTGELSGKVYFANGKIARLRLCVIDDIATLLKKRARFIIERQQLHDADDPRDGAFLPFNNQTETVYRVEDVAKRFHGIPDRNESRERLGMGAFLAALARQEENESYLPALRRYSAFVERCLVDENYDVWDGYERQETSKYYLHVSPLSHDAQDMRFRTFNYVFVLAFFAEMYWLTRETHYAKLVAGIMERYAEKYKLGGNTCMFGVDVGSVRVLRDAGMADRADKMLQYLHDRAYYLLKIDDRYDASEVIYEQGTSASAMREIADYYLETKDAGLLDILEKQRIRNLSFEGNQPDYRSYHAATIHWDDFWFGELEMWGDTMPHYWDTISADAYCMYAKITGDRSYLQLADYMFRNNLALINKDGSCWNCFIYPEKVNGRQGARLEPLANDQDWGVLHIF